MGPVKPEGSRKERARDAALDLPTGLTYSIQIAAKNLLVCPGLAVESDERCVCVWQLHVDGCMWRGGGREHERSGQGKGARVGWVKSETQIGIVV